MKIVRTFNISLKKAAPTKPINNVIPYILLHYIGSFYTYFPSEPFG